MVLGEKAKAASLVLTLIVVAIALYRTDLAGVGIYQGCTLWQRLSYPFFHATIIHCLLNCWVLLSVVFDRNIPLWYIVVSYMVAVSYPAGFFVSLAESPAVGLSGMIFAMLGMVTMTTGRPFRVAAYLLAFILFGAVLPNIAWTLHLYCYVTGLLIGLLALWKV